MNTYSVLPLVPSTTTEPSDVVARLTEAAAAAGACDDGASEEGASDAGASDEGASLAGAAVAGAVVAPPLLQAATTRERPSRVPAMVRVRIRWTPVLGTVDRDGYAARPSPVSGWRRGPRRAMLRQ